MSKKKGFGKFILGAGLGASLAMLFTPKKGSEVRGEIKKKFDDFMSTVSKMSAEDVKEEFTKKVNEIKNDLDNLDKETVVKEAKKKGEALKAKANELVSLAKEKGTPVLEGIADELKEKTISVAKDVIKKLEEK